jgi:uncharacterized heparinase superfamily protein
VTGLAGKIRWYGNRLAAMSAPEIVFRSQEILRRRLDKNHPAGLPPITDCRLAAIPGLTQGLTDLDIPENLIAEWRQHYIRAKAGELCLLGLAWPTCDGPARWHVDPVSNTFWPHEAYCFDIDYRHATGKGDIKYTWERNRLQYLQPIAAFAHATNSQEAAAFCAADIESWIDSNPPYQGINWASGIELALRAVSLLVVTTLAGSHFPPPLYRKILATLQSHAYWLARYPSRFSSANNHRTAEGLGLLAIGALCPKLAGAATWAQQGWNILCQDAADQILPDGVGAEQTITYTAVVLEMLLLGRHIAHATGSPIPPAYDKKLALAGDYLRWFTDAGGAQPRIGDDDNACVLGMYRPGEPYVSAILGCLAADTHRPHLSPPNPQPHLRQALFGAAPLAGDALLGMRHFIQGGYTVWRAINQGRLVMLAFDHGPLGYLSIAAHGHADALAVWLHIAGQPVLVDAGTYLYHAGGHWRAHFRGTPAHNTLCVAGTSSSQPSGNFNWSRKARARLNGQGGENGASWAEAAHDGYRRRFGAEHRRKVIVSPDGDFTIQDRLITKRTHHVSINFLLHPALTAHSQGGDVYIRKDGADILRVTHAGGLATSINPAEGPGCGWYSPSFGVKQHATRVGFAGMLAPSQVATTRFAII